MSIGYDAYLLMDGMMYVLREINEKCIFRNDTHKIESEMQVWHIILPGYEQG